MGLVRVRDKGYLERYLRSDALLHLYSLGDLDEFFWPHTAWYGWTSGGELQAVILQYSGMDPPTVLAFGEPDGPLAELMRGAVAWLPRQFYAHLSPGLEQQLAPEYNADARGQFLRYGLLDDGPIQGIDAAGTFRLLPDDLAELQAFYARAYPDNWFDPRMLETGQYYGLRRGGELVAAAGIHVYSPAYGVAALGNVATATASRRSGAARKVTARLCRELGRELGTIGLNVSADNKGARALYESLGFSIVAEYGEFQATRK